MTDDEITAPEAVETLTEAGVEVTLDELRTLARERRISARKRGGVWHLRPDVVAPQILDIQARSDGDDEADGPEEDRIEEAIERGKEQGQREAENSRRRTFDRLFG
jgi:hypothetical protein